MEICIVDSSDTMRVPVPCVMKKRLGAGTVGIQSSGGPCCALLKACSLPTSHFLTTLLMLCAEYQMNLRISDLKACAMLAHPGDWC